MPRALAELWPIIILLVVLIWAGPKLPGMAKNLAQSIKGFKKEMNTDKSAEKTSDDSKSEDKKDN